MSLFELISQPWISRTGWTLLHFLWQGTVIAILFAITRWSVAQKFSARSRYLLGCGTLALMTAAPFATFFLLGTTHPANPARPLWERAPAGIWQQALPWLVLAWLGGVAVSSARLLAGLRSAARLRTENVISAPADWRLGLDRMAARLRVTKPVRLLVSSRVAVPVVIGWLRPVILFPASALTGLDPSHLEALLAHELAHIRRHDYLINILQSVAEAVLFYHPAVWWVSEQIRNDREMCCDDIAVAASGDVVIYASALADLESRRPLHGELAMAANGGSLLRRIRRLAGKPELAADNLPGSGAALAVGALWLIGVGAMTLYGAPTKPQHAVTVPPPSMPLTSRDAGTHAKPLVIGRKIASTLLFDPFFDQPQTQQPNTTATNPNSPTDQEKIHVTGTIVGISREPLKKATVRLQAIASNDQGASYSETTDDAGRFAITDIAPGSYRLSASKTGFLGTQYGARRLSAAGTTLTIQAGVTLKDLEIALTPQGTIAGRITDQDGDPVTRAPVTFYRSGYDHGRKQLVVVQNLRVQTDDTGRFRIGNVSPGRYYVKADQANQPPDLEPGIADMPTFYPSAPDAAAAAPIEMAAGSRAEGINVKLRRAHVYSVKGTVLLDGAPVNSLLDKRLLSDNSSTVGGGVSVQNGVLALSYVEPGTYTLSVLPSNSVGTGLPFSLGLSGHVEFTVKDSNLEGIVLNLEQGVGISGGFKVEGGDFQSVATPDRLPFIRLAPEAAPRPTQPTRLNNDGTFQLKPLAAGKYILDITSLPSGTYVKSVRYGTLDVSNSPFNVIVGGGELQILLSPKAATINGTLKSSTGDPLYGVQVIAWLQNPNPGTVTRGITASYTDQNGSFTLSGLSPGTWHVAAWEEIDSGLAQDPNFLQYFEGKSGTVTVEEGGQKSADLKLITAEAVAAEASRLPQ